MKTEKDFEIMNEIIGYLSFLLTSFDSEELELIRDKIKERVDDVNTGNMLFLKELVNKYFLENALKSNNNSYYMENMLDCNWVNDMDHGVIKCRKCANNMCRNDEETVDCVKGLIKWIKTQKPGTPVDLCMSDVEHSKGLFVLNFYTLEHIKYCPMCGRQL